MALTLIWVIFTCGDEPVPNREISFSLTGIGSFCKTAVVTNDEGEAEVKYTAPDTEKEGTATIKAKLDGCPCTDLVTNEDAVEIEIVNGPKLSIAVDKKTVTHFEPFQVTVTLTDRTTPLEGVRVPIPGIEIFLDLSPDSMTESTPNIDAVPDPPEGVTDSEGKVVYTMYASESEGTIRFYALAGGQDPDGKYFYCEATSDSVSVEAINENWSGTANITELYISNEVGASDEPDIGTHDELLFGHNGFDGPSLYLKEGTFSGFYDDFLSTYDWSVTFYKDNL